MQGLGDVEEVASVGRWHLSGGAVWTRGEGGKSTPCGGTVEAKVPEMWDSAGYQGVMVPSREGKSRKGG